MSQMEKMLKTSLTDIAQEAVNWVNKRILDFAEPEKEDRPSPHEIFGKEGKSSIGYIRAIRLLEKVITDKKIAEANRINTETSDGAVLLAGNLNIQKSLQYLMDESGLSAEALLEQFLKIIKRDREKSESVKNPIGWEAFNDYSKAFTPPRLPQNIKRMFLEILNSKLVNEKKSHDTGDLDPEKFPTYYTGDVWSTEEASKPKISVYIYSDNSGSMRAPMSGEYGDSTEEIPRRESVMKDILTGFFEALFEAQASGKAVRWAYAAFGSKYQQRKEIDEEIPKSKIPSLFVYPTGDENVWEMVKNWKKIEEAPNEKVIIIVLSDGEFVQFKTEDSKTKSDVKYEPYQLIMKNNKRFVHIWIPIDFDPIGGDYRVGKYDFPEEDGLAIAKRRKKDAIALYGDLKTSTKQEVFTALALQLKKALARLL